MLSINQELKDAGLKITTPRLKILSLFEASKDQHLTAEAIYQNLRTTGEDVSLATVYRVLSQFETAGLIIRHRFDTEEAVFELAKGEHHDHLICIDCNHLIEFHNEAIEIQQKLVAQSFGFELEDHQLHLYGRCQKINCPNKTKEPT
jgi:Fur family ferric uptake transcriptional regulator